MTATCPQPPETVAGVLALALADTKVLVERAKDQGETRLFHNGAGKKPGAAAGGDTRTLRTSIVHGTLARVPRDASPRVRRAPQWRAVLSAADDIETTNWGWAWQRIYGTDAIRGAPREQSSAFAERVTKRLQYATFQEARGRDARLLSATPWPSPRLDDAQKCSEWVAWAHKTLYPAVKRAEAKTLAEMWHDPEIPDMPPAPDTLAEALRLAIDAGRTLLDDTEDSSDVYLFDSSCWHEPLPRDDAACAVGEAGAVIATWLGAWSSEHLEPEDFSPTWCAALKAIDEVRAQVWPAAFQSMHGCPDHPGAEHFAEQLPVNKSATAWRNAAEYAQWLDYAQYKLLPVIRIAETRALGVRPGATDGIGTPRPVGGRR